MPGTSKAGAHVLHGRVDLRSPRWFTESARWLVITGKPNRAVKELKRVARINGKKEEGDKLNVEVKGLDLRDAGLLDGCMT